MIIYLYINIIQTQKGETEVKQQILAILFGVRYCEIKETDKLIEYNSLLFHNTKRDNNNNSKKIIPLLKISNNGKDYNKYHDIIVSFMKNIKNKINYIMQNKIDTLCPLESIILYYMISIIKEGIYTDISITELYNIIDIYSKSFNKEYIGHSNCQCKEHFEKQNNIKINNKDNIGKMNKYLCEHYEKITNMKKIYKKFLNQNPKVNWLINHPIKLNGNKDHTLTQKFKLIGYDNNNAFAVYVKPQVSNLNYNEILIDSIFDTFIINNIDKLPDVNYNRFNNKNIKTIISNE
jgi:hypothetical protein